MERFRTVVVLGFFRELGLTRLLVVTAAAILALLFAEQTSAGTFTVFGAQSYERGRGQPEVAVGSFSVLDPNAPYYVELVNGPGGLTRVSSAVISINGIDVIVPDDVNQQVGLVEKPVTLAEANEIAVELLGTPLGTVWIRVYGVDTGPPTISATFSPEPNANGWNNADVVVSFDCYDAVSGIATCSDPVTVSAETDGYIVAGTATDNAGNVADTSVIVRLDKTAPAIARTWPPVDVFSTDRPGIDIEGDVSDGLSNVDTVELLYAQGTLTLSAPTFMAVGELDTDILPGARWTDNAFVLRATDRAGNRVENSFLVRHTQMAHTLPTDPIRTEVVDGLLTSVDRAMVRFEPSVARAAIDAVVSQEGGRVVGFLPARHTAIIEFDTDLVVDLKNALGSLGSRSEVDVAVPAIFFPEIALDNDVALTVQQRASYDSILSSSASQFIIDSGFSLSPVNVAIIETGMNDSHGQNGEFADVIFYDLCTPEGQAGLPGTPVDVENEFTKSHGTKITGIVAGANNGSGNNGVMRGIPGSQFGVHVFRMNCGGGNDGTLVATAMDLIIGGTLADFHVVNMSFGAIIADLTLREDFRAIYESYFDSLAGRRILWVGGSGNDNQQIACNEFLPSGLACDLDNVVSVGAYNAVDQLRGQWVNSDGDLLGSNWGDGVTINAPGTGVWTATDPGTYGGVSGTSASTPLVAGAAGLMMAVNPLSPYFVKQLLVSEAQPLSDATLPEGGLNMLALLQAGEIPRMILNGLQYLRGQQNADGSYSLPPGGLTPEEKSVATTAMVALAFSQYGIDESDPDLGDTLDWILSQQNADGSISNEGQRFPPKTLDTSFAVLALSATRNPLYYDVIQTATAYIVQAQHDEAEGYASNHSFYGGWTHFYPNYVPPNIIDWYSLPVLEPSTATALHALYFAERFDNTDTILPADVISRADTFLTRCQNYAATNPDFNYTYCFDGVCYYDDGGFARFPPGNSGPWPELLGRDSYAGATAAALWSLYAVGADRLDPRAEPAQVWLGDRLISGPPDENFPQGDRDYYHFLYYLALAGTAWDWDKYELGDHLGEQIDWYQDIADALAVRQHTDGHWVGSSWETDVVATALAVLALESKWTPPGTGLRFRE